MSEKGYLGIDLGSISTKGVLLDENEEIVDSTYLLSTDIEGSVHELVDKLTTEEVEIAGAGVTGSGREFAKSLINADVVKTEIIAHATGTLHYVPDVRTIIDIGGEDSKLFLLEDGIMRDFNMNSICSAGMGACMENIAIRLGLEIEDFGDLAVQSEDPKDFPMKCGVLMSSAVVSAKNKGEPVEDILMGVAQGVARNFLSLTAKGKDLQHPIVFGGMTAHNEGLVKALENQIGKEVLVLDRPELLGAIGMALIASEEVTGKTLFTMSSVPKNYQILHSRDDCVSCGQCWITAPDYFREDNDEKSTCIKQSVEEEDLGKIKETARNCPGNLIQIKERSSDGMDESK